MIPSIVVRRVIHIIIYIDVVTDALSELTRFRAISPFLIPQSIELLYETPRILYQGRHVVVVVVVV
jgi:hypothetical protein